MENVSKALMIAAGILFAILVLTLLVIFFSQMSSYYAEQNNAKMIEQVTEFNNKFDNYSGKTIRGNELISVMNKVVDYNRTYADMEKNERITINIDLLGYQDSLLYTGTTTSKGDKLFPNSKITNANGNDDEINRISELSSKLASENNIDETKLQKLSADIAVICDTSTDESDIKARDEKLRKILGNNAKYDLEKIQNITKKYYQLTQFKRAMFNCTEVVHSQKDGRINKISFEAVTENGALKFN